MFVGRMANVISGCWPRGRAADRLFQHELGLELEPLLQHLANGGRNPTDKLVFPNPR